MSLLSIFIALIIAGILLWLINTYLPIDPKIKKIINIVAVIIIIIWLMRAFGIFGYIEGIKI